MLQYAHALKITLKLKKCSGPLIKDTVMKADRRYF